MFVAINRFRVARGAEADFEQVWTTRDTYPRGCSRFIEFHLLRGPEREDHVLYSSHSTWRRAAGRSRIGPDPRHSAARHRDAGQNKPLYLGSSRIRGLRGASNGFEPRRPGGLRPMAGRRL